MEREDKGIAVYPFAGADKHRELPATPDNLLSFQALAHRSECALRAPFDSYGQTTTAFTPTIAEHPSATDFPHPGAKAMGAFAMNL